MLTQEQLQQLRQDIVLGSLFVSDYQNSLGIAPVNAIQFFDSYIEVLCEKAQENNDYWEDAWGNKELNWTKYDTTHNLWDYYSYLEFDPLPLLQGE